MYHEYITCVTKYKCELKCSLTLKVGMSSSEDWRGNLKGQKWSETETQSCYFYSEAKVDPVSLQI